MMPAMPATERILDRRTLNRTLLERQGLLRRRGRSAASIVEGLVGLQAQEPPNPFVALWSRLETFDPAELDRLLVEREAVRTGLMRTTLHLVTAGDAIGLHPLFAPVLARVLHSQRQFRVGLDGIDLDELVALATGLLAERPMTAGQLRPHLAERWPDRDASVLMMAVRYLVPIVQVPPRGLFRQSRQPTLTTIEAWLGRPVASAGEADVEAVVLRYLRAFGPATTADIRTWSGLTGLAPAIARLRRDLRTYRDEAGRELLDVPDGTIVDGREPAPVRFLPEYDNVFLSHADRARITGPLPSPAWWLRGIGLLLVDGFGVAGWQLTTEGGGPSLHIRPLRDLSAAERSAVDREAEALVALIADEPDRTPIVWHPPDGGEGSSRGA